MSFKVRLVKEDELEHLLALYKYLVPDDPKLEIDSELRRHWNDILQDPCLFYLVVEDDGYVVSTCNISIIKNLTRSAQPYGLIENVVTHPNYRNRGYGNMLLKKAENIAREKGCYKVMLMTSRKDDETLRFYENAGFNCHEKTGFVLRIDSQ